MSSDITISVAGVSKCYQIYGQPRDRLKQFVLPKLQRLIRQQPMQYYHDFWALRDVSFEVARGETVGIVGKNGSGKSTLLQIICGTLSVTEGVVRTNGRIGALLELGSGFNPEFSGRENVYLNASVLGLRKDEIDQRFDDILSFADIGAFVDQPVKTYSSGMMVRLAFAVQAQINPDILIVDEALAVGDAKFQAKCFTHLNQLKEAGTSILLVTHSHEQVVTHCNRAVLLDQGRIVKKGAPREVVNTYLDVLFGKERVAGQEPLSVPSSPTVDSKKGHNLSVSEDLFATRIAYNPHEYRWGTGAASILDFYLAANEEPYPTSISRGDVVSMAVTIRFNQMLVRPIIGFTIKTKEGVTVFGTNTELADAKTPDGWGRKGSVVAATITFKCALGAGDYFISIGLASEQQGEIVPHDRRYDAVHFEVRPCPEFLGLVDLGSVLEIEELAK